MSGPLVVIIVVVTIAVLGALAWWSSGRSGRELRTSGPHESAKGLGTAQGMTHDPPGSHGGGRF